MDLPGTNPTAPADPLAPEAAHATTAPVAAAAAPAAPAASAAPAFDPTEPPPTVDQVKMALRRVKDPDLNLNIIDLGLVYDIAVDDRAVKVDMSLTSPACPSGPQLMGDTERAARAIPGVAEVTVNLVWSPLWSPDRIEPRVRAYLGF
jgi:metal-sulfur cluster biosynthetic enzyme